MTGGGTFSFGCTCTDGVENNGGREPERQRTTREGSPWHDREWGFPSINATNTTAKQRDTGIVVSKGYQRAPRPPR